MSLSEADTRSKLIDPKLYKCGWTEEHIKREETAGTIIVVGAKGKRIKGTTDYTLRIKIDTDSQPVAVAVIEAKADKYAPNVRFGASQTLRRGKAFECSVCLFDKRASIRRV